MTQALGLARLASKPQIKLVGANNDIQVCEVKVRVLNGRWKDDAKTEWEDRSYWADMSIWREYGEQAAKLFEKGDRIYFIGNQYLHQWEHEGQPYERMKIDAEHFFPDTRHLQSLQFVPRKQKTEDSDVKNQGSESLPPSDAPAEVSA